MSISSKLLLSTFFKIQLLVGCIFFFNACATFKEQPSGKVSNTEVEISKKVKHRFIVAGGLGNVSEIDNTGLLSELSRVLKEAPAESTLILTGDNITALEDNWVQDSLLLTRQLALTESFKGTTLFLPGNNEWKSYDVNTMEKVEDYLKKGDLNSAAVIPENGCPIEHKVINDDLDLILIDSKWFVANWSRLVDINKKCTDIVTRRRFMEELEGYINDAQGKNIVIAMHHPVFSNGSYTGSNTFKEHMKPLPIVGTLKNAVLDLGAFNPEHLNSRRYNYLRIAVSALAQASDRITLVSGHEESLQYLIGGGIHQIVSGSLGAKSATKLGKNRITAIGGSLEYEGAYAFGDRGFAQLDYYDDGSSKASFISESNLSKKTVFNVLPPLNKEYKIQDFTVSKAKDTVAQILTLEKDFKKNGFYKFLWGARYRPYYGKSITAQKVNLDTLYGGLKVLKEGGGHQSFSLRLTDKEGKQYAMRSLRKSALKFLKFKLPGIAFNTEDFRDTWAEEVISDFFTTAHPFMQIAVDPLAASVGVNHSDTKLYYVAKHEGLGEYNDAYGDELYYIERRPSEEQAGYEGYRRTFKDKEGVVTDYESTTDMLEKLKSDESYTVDGRSFIRARIFDMLIGDWDRHQDQWRWIEYENDKGDKEFMPVPRDRDNAFPRFDGAALKFVKLFVPNTRNWQSFDKDINNVKWQNLSGNKLDRTLLAEYGPDVWQEEAIYIQENMTPTVIENAFKDLPLEVQDQTLKYIQESLINRLKTLPSKALEYSAYLDKIIAVAGTEKDDLFIVTKLPNGKIKVTVKRLLSGKKNEVLFERTLTENETKELWLYGLGDNDEFVIIGDVKSAIKIRIVGGYGDDIYDIQNKKKLKIFDWEHEKLAFKSKEPRKQLSDIYKTNSYHWRYFKPNANMLVPTLGFRTDDGLYLGASNIYTRNSLNGNPFKQKHIFKANYFFDFQAAELKYASVFANIFSKWNFEIDGYYTSDQYAQNFFGYGNETINLEDTTGRDFYRARLQQFKASAGLAYYTLRIKGLFESFSVNEDSQRFFVKDNIRSEAFDTQNYAGTEVSGYYSNKDAGDFPSKSIYIGFKAGYKANLNLANNRFNYASLKLGFNRRLVTSGALVFGTSAEYMTVSNIKDVFFYHAPSIGGDNGLRGFRDQRFTGKSYFYQSSDLKVRLKRYITAVSPITLGMYGGFDYGRVWQSGEDSNVWHSSQGGGLWISSLKALTFNIGYFNSVEGNLVQVGFGVSI